MSQVQFKEGDVVIAGTGQAGTVIQVNGRDLMVLLTNMLIWQGSDGHCYHPDADVLAAAPLNVDRFEDREKAKAPAAKAGKRREDY